MKILNIYNYIEKLNINPININDLNNVQQILDKVSKHLLKDFYIVQIGELFYMYVTGTYTTIFVNTIYKALSKSAELYGIFTYIDRKGPHNLFVSEYTDDLETKNHDYSEYNVDAIYKTNFENIDSKFLKSINQEKLYNIIDNNTATLIATR